LAGAFEDAPPYSTLETTHGLYSPAGHQDVGSDHCYTELLALEKVMMLLLAGLKLMLLGLPVAWLALLAWLYWG
jgi:hypothetical protein